MSKKQIKHINGTKEDSKVMADAKQHEFVNVKWEATPTWNVISLNKTPESKTDYKLFTEKSDKKDDE